MSDIWCSNGLQMCLTFQACYSRSSGHGLRSVQKCGKRCINAFTNWFERSVQYALTMFEISGAELSTIAERELNSRIERRIARYKLTKKVLLDYMEGNRNQVWSGSRISALNVCIGWLAGLEIRDHGYEQPSRVLQPGESDLLTGIQGRPQSGETI